MRCSLRIPVTSVVVLAAIGCRSERPAAETSSATNVVEITAVERTFQAPDTIPAGWTTFRFRNASSMTHFAVVERMPEGIGIAEQQEQAAPIFQAGMDLLAAGKADEAAAKFGELPEWFGKVAFLGGPGLTAPGHVSEATVDLEPGTYVLECYVKSDGVFHSYNPDSSAYGMVHELTVTGPASPTTAPQADLTLTISGARGIEMSGEPSAGRQTIAVHFADQTVHENFVGHDVHLVRLTDDTDLGKLVEWMDWTQPGGLEIPAPVEFLGGLNEMPSGATGYVTVELEPGNYAWIAEVPHADENGMLKKFAVSAVD